MDQRGRGEEERKTGSGSVMGGRQERSPEGQTLNGNLQQRGVRAGGNLCFVLSLYFLFPFLCPEQLCFLHLFAVFLAIFMEFLGLVCCLIVFSFIYPLSL